MILTGSNRRAPDARCCWLVLTMAEERFGVAVDGGIVQKVDELVAECDDPGAGRSEIVEVILTAFVQSESNHAKQVREIIIRKRKETL